MPSMKSASCDKNYRVMPDTPTCYIALGVAVLLVIASVACASSGGGFSASSGGATTEPAPAVASVAPSVAVPGEASSGSDVVPPPGAATTEPSPDAPSSAIPGDDSDQLELGAQVFYSTCAGCHGQQGQGTPRAPSLVGIAERQPDRETQISMVIYGTGGMRGRARLLTAEEIDAVVSYLRVSFVSVESPDG